MDDTLMIFYDNRPPDAPTLCVVKESNKGFWVLNQIQGDAAFGVYHYLTGGAEMKNAKDIPMKPIGDLDSVPHYRCPSCNCGVALYRNDFKYPHCQWCGQKLDWE